MQDSEVIEEFNVALQRAGSPPLVRGEKALLSAFHSWLKTKAPPEGGAPPVATPTGATTGRRRPGSTQ